MCAYVCVNQEVVPITTITRADTCNHDNNESSMTRARVNRSKRQGDDIRVNTSKRQGADIE
jgi:hypothetical protein